jgi:hypothetical protein
VIRNTAQAQENKILPKRTETLDNSCGVGWELYK